MEDQGRAFFLSLAAPPTPLFFASSFSLFPKQGASPFHNLLWELLAFQLGKCASPFCTLDTLGPSLYQTSGLTLQRKAIFGLRKWNFRIFLIWGSVRRGQIRNPTPSLTGWAFTPALRVGVFFSLELYPYLPFLGVFEFPWCFLTKEIPWCFECFHARVLPGWRGVNNLWCSEWFSLVFT